MAPSSSAAGVFGPKDAIKKVGRGKTLSQDLTSEEAAAAFAALLEGRFTAAQAGAFLQALRIKELTQAELDALFAAVLARMVPPSPPASPEAPSTALLPTSSAPSPTRPPALALNLASDTGRKGGLLSLLAAQVLQAQGHALGVVRSTPVMTRNTASYAQTRALRPAAHFACETPIDALLPGWSGLDALRNELGFRSCLHTVEKLVNPWPQAPLVLGISHKHYADRLATTLQTHGRHGCIVLGNHGTTDLVLHKPTEIVHVAPAHGDGRPGPVETLGVAPDIAGLAPDAGIYSLAQFASWPLWLAEPAQAPSGFIDALILQTAFLAACLARDPRLDAAAIARVTPWVHAWLHSATPTSTSALGPAESGPSHP